jgi:hypothetical protein
MTRDGATIMEIVSLERRRMRRFGESEERSYGGISRRREFCKRVVKGSARSGAKE